MLVSTFEVLLKSQLPSGLGADKLGRKIIQGYFLTLANVNFFPVTVSLVFTIRFPKDPADATAQPKSFKDFIDAVDISGQNLFPQGFPQAKLIPEIVPQNNKARLTFTIPENTTSLVILQPDFISPAKRQLLTEANFEARGYVEIFLSSLSGSDTATLLLTPEQRGTFFKTLEADSLAETGLDQISYALPIANGGVFKLSNS